MEMESPLILPQDKLEFHDILKEALSIPFKSIRFIIFTALTTIPFFCFLVFFEIILQRTFFNTTSTLFKEYHYYGYYTDLSPDDRLPFQNTKNLTRTLSPQLIQLFFLFLVPYNLLELFSITTVVETASSLYAGEKPASLRDLMNKTFVITKIGGRFITYTYVLLLSTSTLFGLMWVVTNCFLLSKWLRSYYSYFDYFYETLPFKFMFGLNGVLHVAAFVLLLMKYMEWSAGWNMSVVISILEEEYGGDAFELSAYFSRGINERGPILMLFFFAWCLSMRLLCLLGGYYMDTLGVALIVLCTGLICAGNVMKWVACVVYFFDCKKRTMEKKIDEEIGRGANQSREKE